METKFPGLFVWRKIKKYKKEIFLEVTGILFFLLMSIIAFNRLEKTEPIHFEIDSYVLPVISIQYRGSLIITQEDIDQARKDFPNLYDGIYSYDDLRSSKLRKIDENHWRAFYFPIYALACLPMKLLLQCMGFAQENCFLLTNIFFFLLAIGIFIKHAKKNYFHYILVSWLLIFNPILQYLFYIGAEPFMYSLVLIALVMWEQKRYKTAIVLGSLVGMINPTAMGIVIIMFLNRCYDYYIKHKGNLINRKTLKIIILLCGSFFFALIPFIAYGYTSWIKIIKNNLLSYDPYIRRVLAYLFDLNFGVASISIMLIIMFLFSLGYSIVKRKENMFLYSVAAIFTIMCFSIMGHINNGMLYCARYIVWVLPVIIFAVKELLICMLSSKERVKQILLGGMILIQFVTVFIINDIGFVQGYNFFSNISKFILNNYPQMYISLCNSTFYNRSVHTDGVYYWDDPIVYSSDMDGKIRKILYQNNEEQRTELLEEIFSLEDRELIHFRELLKDNFDNKNYYICIDRDDNWQYYEIPWLYRLAKKWMGMSGDSVEQEDVVDMTLSLLEQGSESFSIIYDYISRNDALQERTDSDYVHMLYVYILDREESKEENAFWTQVLVQGSSRKAILNDFIYSDEFQMKLEREREENLVVYTKLEEYIRKTLK